MSFEALGLDPRLLRVLEKRKFVTPTPVQSECIVRALKGKDVVARARTGSGKTLAYVLPALQKIFALAPNRQASPWQTLILVPTKELCEQVKEEAEKLVAGSGVDVRVTALTATGAAERDQFLHAGQIVVSTPGRIAQALKSGQLRPQALQPHEGLRKPGLSTLILDEADLILSMPGYEKDLQELAPKIPRGCQCMLMSATTNDSVERLQKLVLHSPVTLDLLDAPGVEKKNQDDKAGVGPGSASEIEHFKIHCSRNDKLLYIMTLLKLNLVKRKVLLFVNSIDSAFRVRLFLESFGIRSAVVNAEQPLNSRHHILQEFNKGIFDYLIATDDPKRQDRVAAKQAEGEEKQSNSKKRKRSEDDAEFGVTRGVDFKGVETVINADAPPSVSAYIHRVGRTGRAGNSGTAITLLSAEDVELESQLEKGLPSRKDPLANSSGSDNEAASGLLPFAKLQKASVEALRYRAEDIARSLTNRVIKEARTKDLKLELLNSQRLAAHFETHPGDMALLKHDKPLAKKPEAPHLKHLPVYLRNAGGMPLTTGAHGVLSAKKRKKLSKGVDPIKGGFLKAPKRGEKSEPLTEMEIRAEKAGKKEAKKESKKAGNASFVPKANVRKKR